ncbi:hypothetical protein Rt10032_c16g5635 [Rhodotorula toruloides]|uniref:Uncharacterized protein n=1 Tax=Rhodotorula toruloides TaxID=5286 RepID=A0A511KML6_RHOTO|nr:hypothetical protein Rt10032_c16g5635 [Rhodotorula toruloides]
MSSSAPERTLAVLFAPENTLAAPYARDIVARAGFKLLKGAYVSGEELEEAGVNLGLGIGEGDAASVSAAEQEHTVIAQDCPTLRMFTAPTHCAATMAINELFPSFPTSPTPASPADVSFPTSESPTAPKPFALSNAAFAGKVQPPLKTTTLSPAIEKALAEVEEREERERLRKLSRSSRSSRASTASPLTFRSEVKTREGTQTPERRVFTNRSPTPEDLEPVEPAVPVEDQERSVKVLEEQQEMQEEEEVEARETAAPSAVPLARPLRRATSAMSAASIASSTSSATPFRARPAPSFTSSASSQPRLTKAAALRLGVSLPPSTPRHSTITRSESGTSNASSQAPSRAAVPTPKCLAAPSITPRLTKTAALRTGQAPASSRAGAAKPRVRQSISTAERAALDRQQRRHSVATIAAPSVPPAPTVEVRMSRAAMLRQGIAVPPTTPRRAPPASTKENRPSSSMSVSSGRKSIVSADLKALREPSITPRMTKSAALRNGARAGKSGRASVAGVVGRFAQRDATEGSNGRPGQSLAASTAAPATPKARPASTLGQSTSRPSVPSTSAPTLTPRTNKAAELRAKLRAAMGAEAAKKDVGLEKG